MRPVRHLAPVLIIVIAFFALLIQGCGGSSGGGGSPTGRVLIAASPDPVIGASVEEGTRKQWQWTAAFRETSGAAVSFTSYDRVISGTNGYHEETRDNPFAFSVGAGSTAGYDFTLISARTESGTPAYVAGTSNYAFHGQDANGHAVTANLTVNLQ